MNDPGDAHQCKTLDKCTNICYMYGFYSDTVTSDLFFLYPYMTWFNSISQLNAWRFFSSVAAVRLTKNCDGYHATFSLEWTCRLLLLLYLISTFGTHILHELLLLLQHMLIDLQFNKRIWYTWESLVPICSMVLEYLPTFALVQNHPVL